MLAELEDSVAAAGGRRVVLQTATGQQAAIGLRTSAGYRRVANFGPYREYPDCVCFARPL
ncbi:hypothetical protein ACFQ0O_32295 [Saccharopolyspora spinosporotrichia]|uniref:Uncharacterized protein n=3 Tax=Saccharopolyspora erythraea TaxID=1836 RepID=A4FN19_SACEN|nr:hypothetical protein SACE_6272 [Saccharopolyspora erythraea NRRL 2338]